MVRIKRKKTKKSGQVNTHRSHYAMELKRQVWWWRNKDNLTLKQLKAKIKEKYKDTIPDGTLCGFYNAKFDEYFNKTAEDRAKVKDTRLNPIQRPDIVLEVENILARRCMVVARTGLPYVARIARLLGLHIYHQLLLTVIFDINGQRKKQDQPLEVEMILSVQANTLITKHMAKSNKTTEFHKSIDPAKNTDKAKRKCNQCCRLFESDINFTLHLFWHSCTSRSKIARQISNSQREDEDEEEEEEEEEDEETPTGEDKVFTFKASP